MSEKIKIHPSVFILVGQFALLLFAALFFTVGITEKNLPYLLYACMAMFLNNILEGTKSVSKNILFLVFQLTFFFFLLGRQFVNYICNGTFHLNFSVQIQKTMMILLFLSLVFCFLGYKLNWVSYGEKSTYLQKAAKRTINVKAEMLFRKSSRLLFYLTLVPALVVIFDKASAVANYGYAEYYANYTSRLPLIIQRIATANDYCIFAFCASLPTKQEAKLPLFFYFMTGVFSLLTGQRNDFLLTLSFIIIYFCLRNQGNNDEKWIGKREVISVCMAVPVIMLFIAWFGYVRENRLFEATNFSQILYILFDQQGVSAKVIAYQQQFHLNPILNQNFTFGPLWNFVTQNQFAHLLLGSEIYHQNTTAIALHGHSFGQSVSYLVLGDYFLKGRGLGSSYIAETMQDYSFLGVVLINLIYGNFMHITKNFKNKGFWMRLYVCFALKGIIYAPRDTAIGPFLSFVTFNSLATLFVIWLGMMMIQQIQRNRSNESIYNNHKKDLIASREKSTDRTHKKSSYIK